MIKFSKYEIIFTFILWILVLLNTLLKGEKKSVLHYVSLITVIRCMENELQQYLYSHHTPCQYPIGSDKNQQPDYFKCSPVSESFTLEFYILCRDILFEPFEFFVDH